MAETARDHLNRSTLLIRKTTLLLLGLILLAAAIWIFMTFATPTNGATLPPPGPTLSLPVGDPTPWASVMAVASFRDGHTTTHGVTATIKEADEERFMDHMANIALQNGWYLHQMNSQGFNLVLPESDLPAIQAMAAHPRSWIIQNTEAEAVPQPPRDLDNLRHIEVNIRYEMKGMLIGVAAGLLAIAAIILGASLIIYSWLLHIPPPQNAT